MTAAPVFPTAQEFVERPGGFDYIVVGGGTAGLVVAARLSEDPNVTVGVLEAGTYHYNEPLVDVPGYFGRAIGNPNFDWAYLTVPQKHANGRPIYHPRGKMLGGSFGLNFMASGRASKEEYDAFESVGNKDWNWQELLKYMKKSETAHRPATNAYDPRLNASFNPDFHGTSGPIHTSHPQWISGLNIPFFDALETLGVHRNPDAASGDPTGSYTILGYVDPTTAKRSHSASGYFAPNASRPNLVILLNAHTTKLTLSGTCEPYVVSGVQFKVGDSSYEVKAKKEVILSAGSFGTPQLLELSGIGRRDVLDRFDIPVKIDLPGVGENLQDHAYILSSYEVSDQLETLDVLRDTARLTTETELYNHTKGIFTSTHSAFAFLPARAFLSKDEIKRMKKEIRDHPDLAVTPAQRKQQKLLEKWFDDPTQPQIEIITYPGFFPAPGKTPRPGARYHTVILGLMHPSSRGNVHIISTNAADKPAVDPAYLSSTVDRDLLVHAVRFGKKLHDSAPLKGYTTSYVEPAWDDDEDEGEGGINDEELREYVKNGLEPIYHPAGTAAMYPREDGGVVDARLKVYGTRNLRIIDASIIPFHIAAHPTATILGMAEKAADIFKADA